MYAMYRSDRLLILNAWYDAVHIAYSVHVPIRAVLFWLFPKTFNLPPKPVGFC